jgi:hypothetical protein
VESIEWTQDTVLAVHLAGGINSIGTGNFICFTYP